MEEKTCSLLLCFLCWLIFSQTTNSIAGYTNEDKGVQPYSWYNPLSCYIFFVVTDRWGTNLTLSRKWKLRLSTSNLHRTAISVWHAVLFKPPLTCAIKHKLTIMQILQWVCTKCKSTPSSDVAHRSRAVIILYDGDRDSWLPKGGARRTLNFIETEKVV